VSVERNYEWVEREYGREKWPAVLDQLESSQEPAPSRALAAVTRTEFGSRDPLEIVDCVVDGAPARMPLSAAVAAQQALIVETVVGHCRPDTGLVVELGSGWGRNLGRIWLEGGPSDAEYVGAEYTAAGRAAAERVGDLIDGLDLRTLPFDYHSPDLSAARRDDGHALVFSAHSVEQIPQLPEAVIEEIVALAPRVTCVHLEPVGWQLDSGRQGSSAGYADEHDYNRNLVSVLRAAEADGRIAIQTALPDVVGVNPRNSTSVIVWSAGG
jgi:hypothetical protein